MKEKKYFCDYMLGPAEFARVPSTVTVILSFIVVIAVIGSISYNVLITKYAHELNSYSETTYKYLVEIANNVIQEGAGIDLRALPDDVVVKYEITSENNEVIFKYWLGNNKDMKYATSANMIVKLSKDFEIISKSSNYFSEEDYVSGIKFGMIFESVMNGVLIWFALVCLGIIGCLIATVISLLHKKKNLS